MSGGKPRTGARRAADSRRAPTVGATPAGAGPGPAPGATATHRGIRWQRHPSGVIRWWDGDTRRWVPYRPGDDAPPRPPGWEPERRRGAGPATDRSQRASWRSPYRIVPLLFFVAIVIIGLFAFRTSPSDQAKSEAQAAAKLLHACLHQNGTANGHPEYSSTPVSCTSPRASVRVVQVLPGTPGSPGCGPGQAGFSLPYPGVRYPHVLCTVPVAHPG